jgi:hypothetical protein
MRSLPSWFTWGRRAHVAQISGAISGRNVHAAAECNSQVRVVATNAFALVEEGDQGEAASRLFVEFKVVPPQDMFHLHNGAKQRLAAEAHRAVVTNRSLARAVFPAHHRAGMHVLFDLRQSGLGGFCNFTRECRVFILPRVPLTAIAPCGAG